MAEEMILGFRVDRDGMSPCPGGASGSAVKDGRIYLCRRYDRPGGVDAEAFEKFAGRRERLNTRLWAVFGDDVRISLPREGGMHGGSWVEFYDCINQGDPVRPWSDGGAALSREELLMLVLDAADTLNHLHSHHIVHGGLTPQCIEPVRDRDGRLHSRLTGLDCAFFEDAVPGMWYADSAAYRSPEQGMGGGTVTAQSDLFSLGLILHEYLADAPPEADCLPPQLQQQVDMGAVVYPWQVLVTPLPDGSFGQLKISANITDPVLTALISDMLHPNASRRPAISEVSRRLRSRTLPIECKTWPGDGITINPDIAGKKVIGLRTCRVERKGQPELRGYEILEADGRRSFWKANGLVRLGIASVVEVVDDPWREDRIRWDEEKMRTMFACVRRGKGPGLYQVTDRAGNTRQCTIAQLKMLRFALPKGRGTSACEPIPLAQGAVSGDVWAEDRGRFRVGPAAAAAQGLMFDGPAELCGIRGYRFSDIHGIAHFINKTNCLLRKLLIPE